MDIITRSSQLGIRRHCGMCYSDPDYTESDATQLGKEVHAAIATYIDKQAFPAGLSDEAMELCQNWRSMGGDTLVAELSDCKHETEAPADFVYQNTWKNTGTTDLLVLNKQYRHCDNCNQFTLYDWKTGYTHSDHKEQMAAYAFGVFMMSSLIITQCQAEVWNVRDKEKEVYTFTSDEMILWGEQTYSDLKNSVGKFVRGSHCIYCPSRLSCPAWVKSVQNAITVVEKGDVPTEPIAVSKAFETCKRLNKVIKSFEDMLHDQILELCKANNGSVKLGDTVYKMQERGKESIGDAMAAYSLLRHYVPETDAMKAISIKKGDMVEIIREHQKQVNKGLPIGEQVPLKDAEKQLLDELRDMGILMNSTYYALTSKKEKDNG